MSEKNGKTRRDDCFSMFFGDDPGMKKMREECMKMKGSGCNMAMKSCSEFFDRMKKEEENASEEKK